mmetsp:Transcript_11179/g.21687  ORF Transcript_11179/g.21687 Transcript_11179/m.21687 type:complete len:80 (+) Transcript_11179:955-1194(+)
MPEGAGSSRPSPIPRVSSIGALDLEAKAAFGLMTYGLYVPHAARLLILHEVGCAHAACVVGSTASNNAIITLWSIASAT